MLASVSSFADHSLSSQEVNRYSRQLLLPEIGIKGQEALKNGKVLVIGAGGLGCPVAIYLASAGVGELGIVDYDEVELNNLHRQIGHNERRLHKSKAESLKETVMSLNSNIRCTAYNCQLIDKTAAIDLIKQYDVICDCSDNVPTRYMLNDACVASQKPLVSGSALRWEGQLTVYNFGDDCPCYRCLFPKPPPPETVTSCAEGGVLGAVCGLIGSLQALETVKILTGLGPSFAGKLLLFNGLTCEFRPIRLRKKNAKCEVCAGGSVLSVVDYEEFCCTKACDKVTPVRILTEKDRITVKDLQEVVSDGNQCLIVDCRPSNEYEICRLPNSINLPLSEIETASSSETVLPKLRPIDGNKSDPTREVFVICHRGNDSQKAVVKLRELLPSSNDPDSQRNYIFKDVIGGLESWSSEIDPGFPRY